MHAVDDHRPLKTLIKTSNANANEQSVASMNAELNALVGAELSAVEAPLEMAA